MEGKFADQPLMEAEIRMALAQGFGEVRNFRAGAQEAEKALAKAAKNERENVETAKEPEKE